HGKRHRRQDVLGRQGREPVAIEDGQIDLRQVIDLPIALRAGRRLERQCQTLVPVITLENDVAVEEHDNRGPERLGPRQTDVQQPLLLPDEIAHRDAQQVIGIACTELVSIVARPFDCQQWNAEIPAEHVEVPAPKLAAKRIEVGSDRKNHRLPESRRSSVALSRLNRTRALVRDEDEAWRRPRPGGRSQSPPPRRPAPRRYEATASLLPSVRLHAERRPPRWHPDRTLRCVPMRSMWPARARASPGRARCRHYAR